MNYFFLKKIKFVLLSFSIVVCLAFASVVAAFKFCYPIGYTKEINAAAKEFDLDVSLVQAIVKEESKYNYKAVSKKGAVGLMQLMPSTACWIADSLGEELGEDMLFNPAQNIRYGCFYLRYLFNKFESLDMVLFAYNAGEGTLQTLLESDSVINLRNTEISETNRYIKKVTKAYKVYKDLYKIENKI